MNPCLQSTPHWSNIQRISGYRVDRDEGILVICEVSGQWIENLQPATGMIIKMTLHQAGEVNDPTNARLGNRMLDAKSLAIFALIQSAKYGQ